MAELPVVVDLTAELDARPEPWQPLTVAEVNGEYDVRVTRVEGEFTRHTHPDTDEFFLVLAGRLTIAMDDGKVVLGPGQSVVVPRGTAHQPLADAGTRILLLEPSATVNTGDAGGDLTASRQVHRGAPRR